MAKLPIFEPMVDPEYSEKGEKLGIDLISNVANPAVGPLLGKVKGFAFSADEPIKNKFQSFRDEKKYRIASAVMVPGLIYRSDDSEYYMKFTAEKIEELSKLFMSELSSKNGRIFNLEHTKKIVDAFIFESILVDSDAKKRMILEDFKMEVPLGTFFIVQQFKNKDSYNDIVNNNQIKFSIEGWLGMKLAEFTENYLNKTKIKSKLSKMKRKQKFVGQKRNFSASKKRQNFEELVLIVDELVEGAEVSVIGDEGTVEDNFTGEIDIVVEGVAETVIVEEGVIAEIVIEEAAAEMESEDEDKKVEAEEDKKVEAKAEDVKEEDKADDVKADTDVKDKADDVKADTDVKDKADDVKAETEVVDEKEDKLLEVYEMISELKAEIETLKNPVKEEEEVLMKRNFAEVLASFNKKFN